MIPYIKKLVCLQGNRLIVCGRESVGFARLPAAGCINKATMGPCTDRTGPDRVKERQSVEKLQ